MKSSLRLSLIAAAVLAVAGVAVLAMKPAQSAPATVAARSALTVTLTGLESQDWPQRLELSGPLAAWQLASIGAEESGLRIAELLVDVGSPVKRGQLLARLDDAAVQAEVRAQEAALAQARAKWQQAQSDARRADQVKDSGALSEQKLTEYRLGEAAAKANVDAAEAALASARVRLTHTRITAPDDGVIASRSATLGKVVSSGSELFTLVRQGRIEWRAEVSAAQLPLLKPGQGASVTLPGGTRVDGKLRLVGPVLDDGSRTAIAYVDLPAGGAARAGMYSSGTLDIGHAVAQTLPADSVVLRDGRSYVFVVGADGRAVQRQVVTGRRQGQRVEIVSGLSADLRVVERGGAFLNNGDAVSVAASTKGAA